MKILSILLLIAPCFAQLDSRQFTRMNAQTGPVSISFKRPASGIVICAGDFKSQDLGALHVNIIESKGFWARLTQPSVTPFKFSTSVSVSIWCEEFAPPNSYGRNIPIEPQITRALGAMHAQMQNNHP